jgi:hypothetical protein
MPGDNSCSGKGFLKTRYLILNISIPEAKSNYMGKENGRNTGR